MSHTPGPWTVSERFNPNDSLRMVVGGPMDAWIAKTTGSHSEDNARLIAAAPEMLEALQLAAPILNEVGYIGQSNWTDEQITKAFHAVRAAIAKATGGES